jgi:hypothetical protein
MRRPIVTSIEGLDVDFASFIVKKFMVTLELPTPAILQERDREKKRMRLIDENIQ